MEAFAYFRTSSQTNVGGDKDSLDRQRAAISKLKGFEVVQSFYDAGIAGSVDIQDRPAFAQLLDAIEGNGVRTVLLEDASRFARELITQELGLMLLIKRGVKVYAANGDELTATDDPMRKAMRQIAGTFAELEKARLVSKLASGRARKAAAGGRAVGRLSMAEKYPEALTLAKKLRRKSPKTGKRTSFAKIAEQLEAAGHVIKSSGKRFSPSMVQTLCEGR